MNDPLQVNDPLVIRRSAHWLWRVHINQAHLGHMVFIARRDTQGSLTDCTPEEWADLRTQIAAFEQGMRNLFAPDRFNYTQFGNEWTQLHLHGFPRYSAGAAWNGRRFPDLQWGKAPIPEPPSLIEGGALETFAGWLGAKLKEMAA